MLYDPFSRQIQEDPYPRYRHFRDEQPCAYNPEIDFYALFRFEDVWNATLDWKTYSSRLGHDITNKTESGAAMSFIGMDPPRQVKLRNLISRSFTPHRAAALEPQVRRIAHGYLDRLRGEKECDFQEALGNKLPMDVISAMLGLPEEIRDDYRHWMDKMLERDPETGEQPPEGAEGMQKARAYLSELMKKRRVEPRDDLMTVLAHCEYEDVDRKTKTLTEDEVMGMATLLGAAGAETTQKLLGNCIVYLARHPDQRQRLWDDPSLIPAAVEEVLRYDAPSQFQGRVAQREVRIHGVTIPEGARVALVTGAACRDEGEFDDAERFDIDRRPTRQLYFGYGQHVCVGKDLARLEARVVLEEIGERFPRYEVEEAGLTRTYQAHVRGFATVPIRL